jgi:hypothetical protein
MNTRRLAARLLILLATIVSSVANASFESGATS